MIKLWLNQESGPFIIKGFGVDLHFVILGIKHIKHSLKRVLLPFLCLSLTHAGVAQINIASDLTKPKAYENRKLASELTPDKKINPVKRVKQNIVSHYNFHFNASRKINAVLASAKQAHKDTFTRTLSFYNYSLDQTATQQTELDSVIYKSNNGILLHDLRNDWVDDLYFLMGQSYYYQKKFDSAYDVFQYINYNFQPRKKDEIGYEKNIGSNANENGNVLTVSTKESKLAPHRPVRNDALVWIIKTLLAQDNDDDAKGLIETLYKDNQFPERLRPFLAEMKALWFYKQGASDSAAAYLEKSLPTCSSNDEKARRHFLMAQLYVQSGKNKSADDQFEKAVALTTDPVLEAYARIYQTGLTSGETDQDKKTDNNIRALESMASREKYAGYRSLIYAAAAEMEIKRGGMEAAIALLLKSNAFNQNDPGIKNESNIKIAEMAFDLKKYELAKTYFDSINAAGLPKEKELNQKKSVANDLAIQFKTIAIEDSLQRIALLPEKERETYLKELVRKLRKEKGLADESDNKGVLSNPKNNLLQDNISSLFPTDQKKGEWYFNNPALKAQGAIAFKNKWGDRANVDNWRRSQVTSGGNKNINQNQAADQSASENKEPTELTIEALTENLPLTQEKIALSNDKRHEAFRSLAVLYKDKLGFCKESIEWNEKLLSERPDHPALEKILFDLSYCYRSMGNESKSSFYQTLLAKNFPGSTLSALLKDPLAASKKAERSAEEMTAAYARVYDMFLSGKFKEAREEKTRIEKANPGTRWTPQLLYIEAVYYVKNRQDSLAVATLNQIPALFPSSPLAEKAGMLADVVNRRESIENELRSMTVVREKEDTLEWIEDKVLVQQKIETVKKENPVIKPIEKPVVLPKPRVDTVAVVKAPVVPETKTGYSFSASDPHAVLMILYNVDPVYINEAKRALTRYNGDRFAAAKLNIQNNQIGTSPFILISVFANANDALNYIEKTAPIASKEIFPWLAADKYKFLIVSPDNIKRIMEEKSVEAYLQFIRSQLPGKF